MIYTVKRQELKRYKKRKDDHHEGIKKAAAVGAGIPFLILTLFKLRAL